MRASNLAYIQHTVYKNAIIQIKKTIKTGFAIPLLICLRYCVTTVKEYKTGFFNSSTQVSVSLK